MYVKSRCPRCGNPNWHDVHVAFGEDIWKETHIKDTVSEGIFVAQVIRGVRDYVKEGMKISELCRLLVEFFDIARNLCCDLIENIKLELCLYSPDGKHLHYAYRS